MSSIPDKFFLCPFKGSDIERNFIFNWLEKNTTMGWDYGGVNFFFQCKEDAAKFMLFCPKIEISD